MNCCDPSAPRTKCAQCGSTVHTCEREYSDNGDYRCPAHQDGFESGDGLWFCSNQCFDRYEIDRLK